MSSTKRVEKYNFQEKTIVVNNITYPMKIMGMYDAISDIWAFGPNIQNYPDDIVYQFDTEKYDKIYDVELCCKMIAVESDGLAVTMYHNDGFVVFYINE